MTHRKPILALLTSLLLAPLAALHAADTPQPGPKPNIVLILADDLGYGDVSCYHAQTLIRTPHLDHMAAEGMRFTSFYAQPFCGPSRAALMTGCYPLRVAEIGNKKHHMTVPHAREMLLSEVLKRAGYATAQIGKWDLAGHAPDDFEHPENQLDGRDISAWLRDGPPADADDAVHYYHVGTHLQAVRQGCWKLHLPRPYPVPWLHPGIRRAHVADADRFEIKTPLLYDLDTDVGEKTDVAAQHPEVVQALLALAEKARAEIGDYDRVGSGARFFDDGPKRPDMHAWKSEPTPSPAPKANKGRAKGASSAAAKPNVIVESPRPANVTIGPRELVRARQDMPFVMDSSLATLRRDQDSWFFYHTVDWGNRIEKWRGTPTNPFQAKVWQKSRDELFDLRGGYANVHHAGLWLLNIHRLPDGNLLGVVHVELHPGKPAVNHGEKYALGLVFSRDGGERWVFCGEIVRPQNPHGNVGGAPWLVVGDYFHVYFNDDGPAGRRAAVARAPVAEVLNAARRGSVSPWRKFSDGAWEQDGLTGYGSAILPQPDLGAGHPLDLHADAAWNRALGKYMLTSWCAGGGVGRLYLHVSDDAIRFEPPILVDEEPGQWMPYSTFLTDEQDRETDDMNSVGAGFFLLINHKSATNYSVDSLWRRKITVTGMKVP